jgi:DNA-binding MarR family transcriptional regulator
LAVSNTEAFSYATTIKVRDACLCLHLQRAARAVARHFDDAFRALGLTNGQFSLLMALNRPQPAPMGSVAQVLAMDRTTLTAALKPLQRRGLIEVIADPGDRRARRLILTLAGRTLLTAAMPIWEREHAAIEASLPSADPDQLRADLCALAWPDRLPA